MTKLVSGPIERVHIQSVEAGVNLGGGVAGATEAKQDVGNTLLQAIDTLLTARLPAVLAAQGGLKVEGVAGGTSVPISGTVTADTELPAAAALADAASNPTTPTVGAALKGYNGASWDRLRTPNVYKALAAVAIGSIATVWTPAGGKKFRLMGGSISVSAAVSILFEDNAAGTTIIQLPKLLADTPYNFDLGNGVLSGAADRLLKATSSAAANVTGYLYGTEE